MSSKKIRYFHLGEQHTCSVPRSPPPNGTSGSRSYIPKAHRLSSSHLQLCLVFVTGCSLRCISSTKLISLILLNQMEI